MSTNTISFGSLAKQTSHQPLKRLRETVSHLHDMYLSFSITKKIVNI